MDPARESRDIGGLTAEKSSELGKLQRQLRRAEREARQWKRVAETSEAVSNFSKKVMLQTQAELEETVKELEVAHDKAIAAGEELELRVQERTAELEAAKDDAERASQIKGQLLANVSHELRTPLHGVLSFASIGMAKVRTASQEQLAGYFQRIHDSGKRQLALVNDLLDLAKLEDGTVRLDLEGCQVPALISTLVEEMKPIAAAKRIRLKWRSRITLPVGMDRARMLQVLRNIVANAIRFTPDGTTVGIIASFSNEHLRICVWDHGVGIPEDEIDTIFEAFRQSNRTATGAGGTGLGLSICREIIHHHAGRIWAQNRTKQGAVFFVEIPATAEQQTTPQPSPQEDGAAPDSKTRDAA